MDAALGLSPLTPLAQLDRAADYLPDRVAYRFEGTSTSYADFRGQVEHHVDGVALEQTRHLRVAGEIELGETGRDQVAAAGGLQLLDHVAAQEARAAGDQHASVGELQFHRLMNSSTHSLT